jgi:hypothetical protein
MTSREHYNNDVTTTLQRRWTSNVEITDQSGEDGGTMLTRE